MKKIEVIIDGKTYQAEMSEEQVKIIENKEVKTGYERVQEGEEYHTIDRTGEEVLDYDDKRDAMDTMCYENANYYSDEKLAVNIARADKLMRQLRRFAVEENAKAGVVLDWKDFKQQKYDFYYDYKANSIVVNVYNHSRSYNTPYFATLEIAEKAIETYKAELTWYYTEYKDYADYAEV